MYRAKDKWQISPSSGPKAFWLYDFLQVINWPPSFVN